MPLSSNSLMHFTNEKDHLKSILSQTFKIHYCKEVIDFGGRRGTVAIFVPMISFCDIPLSQIKNHISSYGEYGIGMSKEWAISHKLNPVLYFQRNSSLSDSYKRAFHKLVVEGKTESDEFADGEKALTDILRYIKNYEGDLKRMGKTHRNYRFSDEREWRYVPPYSDDIDMILLESATENDASIKTLGNEQISNYRLKFGPDDIRYIIVKDDNDIEEFIEHLHSVKGSNFERRIVEKLTTRILTSKQINEDI